MKEFNSLMDFAKHLEEVVKKYEKEENNTLNLLGSFLVKSAKDKIGHLQPYWEPLAESTKHQKAIMGYGAEPDFDPLLRTGKMRDSITHSVNGSILSVGSNDQIMVYQELGTKRFLVKRIPPRSVIKATFFLEKKNIEHILMKFLIFWIASVENLPLLKSNGKIQEL